MPKAGSINASPGGGGGSWSRGAAPPAGAKKKSERLLCLDAVRSIATRLFLARAQALSSRPARVARPAGVVALCLNATHNRCHRSAG